jgi:hypothetical protein
MQMKKHASQKEGTLRWQEIERWCD